MSDELFQQAVSDVLPVLESLKLQRGAHSISRVALERLERACPSPEPPPHLHGRVEERTPDPPAPVSLESGVAGFASLDALRDAALQCRKCPHLASFRTGVVVGVGNPDADLLFVGEAPGADEDKQGEPFVGRAGQLLTKMIEAMGITRSDVYIANILKCRPDMPAGQSGNRKPRREEMETCLPWLRDQIRLIRPRAMVALGATAAEGLLGLTDPLARLRGKWHEFQAIPVMVTYHPAYLLRNQSLTEKRKVWEDLLMVMEKIGLPITPKQRAFFLSRS